MAGHSNRLERWCSLLLEIFTLWLEEAPSSLLWYAFSPTWSRSLNKVTFRGALCLKLFSGSALGEDGSAECLYREGSRKNFDEENAIRKANGKIRTLHHLKHILYLLVATLFWGYKMKCKPKWSQVFFSVYRQPNEVLFPAQLSICIFCL